MYGQDRPWKEPAVTRLPLLAAVALALIASASARAATPAGWDHLGNGGSPGTASLNGAVRAFNTDQPGTLLVGGSFTDGGGLPNADHIAIWDGATWTAFNAPPLNGDVSAIAYSGGRVFAGGTFTDAGGNANADFLAVWDGRTWAPFCNASGPAFGGNVTSLQIIGSTLYVGGSYQNGAGIPSADYLLKCDLNTGAPSSPFATDGESGGVYALTADSNGMLYAAGTFINEANIPAADFVAAYDGANWHALGSGTGPGGGAVTGISRAIHASGTDVYLGTDATDVAGIPLADHVAKWDGSTWSAMGSNAAGSDGWFPATTSIYAITTSGSAVFAGGQFQNADGNAGSDGWFPATTSIYAITTSGSAVFAGGQFQNADGNAGSDAIAVFGNGAWNGLGTNGAADGPLNGTVLALTIFGGDLHVGGNFTSADGDSLARFAATYSLTAGALPPPVRGVAVNAVPEKGKVFVKRPGGRFVSLESLGGQIPVGSTLDTRKGTVRLSSAADASGRTQEGHFSQGQFKVLQSKKNPLTTLSMTGAGLNACSGLPAGGAPKAVASRKKRSRSLFSNVKGRFRTRGRNSTATVRGTRYLVKDTCKGTLTKVRSGTVVVRDLRLRRTKTVKSGHSYLARAPQLTRRRGNR